MDKAALLDAIAKSGSAGRAAYEQAQQALAGQQAEAVRMALASGVAGQAPAGAQAELERIVSQPYQSRTAQLAQNQASMEDWYNRLSASRGSWADQQKALQDVALQQALAEATGGGGGGGRTPKEPTWSDVLRDEFGTIATAKDALKEEAIASGAENWRESGMSPTAAIRAYATSEYGIPESVAATWYPESEFSRTYGSYGQNLPSYTRKQAREGLRNIIEDAAKVRRTSPGSYTGYTVSAAKEAARQKYGPKFVKKTSRRARQ